MRTYVWTIQQFNIFSSVNSFHLERVSNGMFNAPEGSSFFYQNGSLTLYNTGIMSKQVFN